MIHKRLLWITLLCVGLALGFCAWRLDWFVSKADSPVLARIGYYNLTAADFRKRLIRQKGTVLMPDRCRAFLDNMIWEEILLQEAQREKMDQSPEFLDIIETFWRQTLITQLIKSVNRNIRDQIRVGDREVEIFYERSKFQYRLRIFEFSDRRAADAFYHSLKNAPDEAVASTLTGLLRDTGWMLVAYDNIEPVYRGVLEDEVQAVRGVVIPWKDRVYVVFLRDKVAIPMPALAEVERSIRDRIAEDKYRHAYETWAQELRARTPVDVPSQISEKLQAVSRDSH